MWMPIAGYEDSYEVSSDGQVRGIDRVVKRPPSKRRVKGVVLKPHMSNSGYQFVLLRKDGKQSPFYIHRLVAQAFVENPNHHNTVNHKDENKLNNQASNLEWCSHGYNMAYAGGSKRRVRNLVKPVLISKDGALVKRCESIHEAASYLGVDASCISRCCRHIKGQTRIHGYEVAYARGMRPITDNEPNEKE